MDEREEERRENCLASFNACPHCLHNVDGATAQVTCTLYRTYAVDSDGDVEWGNPMDSHEGEDDSHDGELSCGNCGNTFTQTDIEFNYSPEDCDCEECQPDLYALDPDELIRLNRTNDPHIIFNPDALPEDAPEEVVLLLTRRSISHIPIRRERATEVAQFLEDEHLGNEVYVQNMPPAPTHLALVVPEPEEEAA